MQITFKLFAGLSQYLPSGSVRNSASIDLEPDETVHQFIHRQKVPSTEVHLVLVNGKYLSDTERMDYVLEAGDTLAIWPPVAGG
ncbi:MAG: MoaD/ThiS family protein [Proteobacteria bacterium]|mgnify:FL=1|nr:MoaD/ThiS family protein [Pseudomonadota bacterium]MBT7671335.1 MoaD/ThiS family protein [Pseudomonadota bacterium]